jgi:hypothetical protein
VKKTTLCFVLAAIAVMVCLAPAGCASEKTNSPPASSLTIYPSATQPPVTTAPAPTTFHPSSVAATPAPATTPAQPAVSQSSPAMDASLKALMDKSQGISSLKYDISVSNGLMNSKAYQKKNKTRMETSMMGLNVVLITDKDKGVMYTCLADQNKATKTDLNQAVSTVNQADIQGFWNNNIKETGTETLEGKTCTVAEYHKDTTEGKVSGKIWLWQDYGLPLRMDSTMSGTGKESLNMTVTIEFKNYEFTDIPDNKFDLPAGVEMVDKLDFFPAGLPSGLSTKPPAK